MMAGWPLTLLAVAAAGAIGGICRYWLSSRLASSLGEQFPWGTLAVNVSGAAVAGVVAALLLDRATGLPSSPLVWLYVVGGFLGSYTTVSSFALQTLALARSGRVGLGVAYVAASFCLCLGAVWGGFIIANWWS